MSLATDLLDLIECPCLPERWTGRVLGGEPGVAAGISVWACEKCVALKLAAVGQQYGDVRFIPTPEQFANKKLAVDLQYGPQAFETTEKRFYIPGAVLRWTCRNCGTTIDKDFSRSYFSYPVINGRTSVSLYCPECDYDDDFVDVSIRLQVEIESEARGDLRSWKAKHE